MKNSKAIYMPELMNNGKFRQYLEQKIQIVQVGKSM
jgi:hypothetical protein